MTIPNAAVWIEIGLEITGSPVPAEPDVGIMSPGWEDIDVDGVFVERKFPVFKTAPNGISRVLVRFENRRVNLMEGVDPKSKDVQRLLENLLEAAGDAPAEALQAEMAD